MHFVGLGHSHIVALAKGAYALLAAEYPVGAAPTCAFHYLYDPQYEPAFELGSGRLNPNILAAACEGGPDFIVASIGGNEHNVLGVPQASSRFDFILGEAPDLPLDPRAEILPESAVRETLRSWMREKLDVVEALRSLTSTPIYLIEPPPPLPRRRVLAYPKEFFRSAMERRQMSSDRLRYKMWRVQSSVYQAVSAARGLTFVSVPPSMIDPDGMLIEPLCGEDATHANEAFGKEILREVLRRHGAESET